MTGTSQCADCADERINELTRRVEDAEMRLFHACELNMNIRKERDRAQEALKTWIAISHKDESMSSARLVKENEMLRDNLRFISKACEVLKSSTIQEIADNALNALKGGLPDD